MHIILTGATGLVGSGVLAAMLRNTEITKISIISRRPVKMAEDARDPRVDVILHRDFARLDADADLRARLAGAAGCVWALGVSQTLVGPEEYVAITRDYALSAARAFGDLARSQGRPFDFVYVSGYGATTRPPGLTTALFARVKGETELALARMREENPLLRADSVRPCFVDCSAHDAIRPYVPAQPLMRRAAAAAAGLVVGVSGWMRGRYHSPTEPMGRFLTEMAMGKFAGKLEGPGTEKVGTSGFTLVENHAMMRLLGQN